MNAVEMIYAFEQFLGTLDLTLEKPKTADTIDFLNLAQGEMHSEYYRGLDVNENAKKLLAPFQSLDHEITTFVPFPGAMFNAVRVVLPDELQYVIREELEVNVDRYGRIGVGNGPTVREVRPINYDYYNANKDNPVRKPYYNVSWRLDARYFADAKAVTQEHLLIMAPGIVPVKYFISYVRSITDLTNNVLSVSEFPAWHHDDIVKFAVGLYAQARSGQQEPETATKED